MTKNPTITFTAVSASITALLTFQAHADTITVCQSGCDHTSINAAIAAADDGDVIQLSAETYVEGTTIDTLGKAIEIRGVLDAEDRPTSILDGATFNGTVLEIRANADRVRLNGLLIRNGNSGYQGGGILSTDAAIEMDHCVIEDCTAPYGGGIYLNHTSDGPFAEPSVLRNSTFQRNWSQHWCETFGRPLPPDGSGRTPAPNLIEDCSFLQSGSYHGSLILNHTILRRCRVAGGSGTLATAGILGSGGRAFDCVFEQNAGGPVLGSYSGAQYVDVVIEHCLFRANGGTQILYPNNAEVMADRNYFCGSVTPFAGGVTDGGGNIIDPSCIPVDCNENGIEDLVEILLDTEVIDVDEDWTPDECQLPPCPSDLNENGTVEAGDLGILIGFWGTDGGSSGDADINGDGVVNAGDLGSLLGAWGVCP